MDQANLLAFVAAAIVILVVPGPTVTVIVANSLRHGTSAGLMNILGTQIGVLMLFGLLAIGFEAIAVQLAWAFDWLRFAGGAYLIWLGWKMLRSDGDLGQGEAQAARSNLGFALQGFLVILSNPKMLFFLGAFLPPFIDPAQGAGAQVVLYGAIFVVLATVLDGAYAVAAGRAGRLLTRSRVRTAEVLGGTALVGGGLWLAFQKQGA